MNQSYIETKLGGIFEPMVASIVKDKPVDCADFMLRYLKDNYGNRPSINANERMELDYLRHEVEKLKKIVGVISIA